MIPSLLALLVAAALAAPFARRLGRSAAWILPLPLLAVATFLASRAPAVLDGDGLRESVRWVDTLGVDLALRLDGLSWLFALLVTGIGALVLVHAAGAFGTDARRLGRFTALTLLFATSMLGLVLADDLLVLFVFWELTSVCSFLLIGLTHEKETARSGALRALLVTGGGGLALLLGLLLLAEAGGTTSIATLLERGEAIRSSPLAVPALLLVLAGAFTKSAQVPFHHWLPGAMAAPGPVSAYLHSATLVKAGVYLLARLHPVLGPLPEWHVILGHAGALTMLVGAAMAFAQSDLKRMLAYTTVAGLGTAVMLLGLGTVTALRAAILFVAVHALYKAALFMVVSIVEKRAGHRDVDRLAGLGRPLPMLFLTALVAALSMAGLPPLLGAIAKELVYEAKLGAPEAPALLAAVGTLANALTVACAVLVGVRPFVGRGDRPTLEPAIAPTSLLLPPAVLAVAGLLLGAQHGRLLAPVVEAALAATGGGPVTAELLADASPTTVSWLSKGTLLAGLVLVLARPWLRSRSGALVAASRFGPARVHDGALAALGAAASRVASSSSRRVVASTLVLIVAGVVVAGAQALGRHGLPAWPGDVTLAGHEAALVALVLASTVSAAWTRSPHAAVVALGVLGLGTGLLFLLLGAPDLALTQVAVDSLAVLLLLLVLRRAGPAAVERIRRGRLGKGTLALAVGALFTLLTWSAVPGDGLRGVSRAIGEGSWTQGHGRNVVNVVLVDVRALDTLGEIVVLTAAALGVVALLRNGRERPA